MFNRLTTVGNHVHRTRRSNEFTAAAIIARVQAGAHLDIDGEQGGGTRTHDCFLVQMSTGGKMRFKTRICNVDVIAQKALCMAYHDCPVSHPAAGTFEVPIACPVSVPPHTASM